jgi:type I restriction enzyme S subunit
VCEPITDSIDTQKYPNEVFAEYSMPAFDASMKPDIVLGSSMNSVRKIITRPCLLVNKLNVRKKRIWYVKKPNKNAVCSAEFIPLHSDTVDLTFLNQVAKSETFTRYLENHSSGSSNSQKRITPRSLMLSKLHIPTIEEQKLIGKIFESLDHTITLHEEKKRQLERLKRALLQKMFADKSGYPAVRFKGFGGNWKERKFGELGTIEMCKRIFKDQTTDDGEIPFYKIGTFGGRPNAYISREIFERYKRLYPYPTKGDILISTSGSIGRVVEYTGQEAYYQDSNIVWLNHNDLISNSFLKYLYKTVNWNGVEGSTIKRLYNNNILKTKIRIPSSCEQEKIGGILSTLDHLLSHHQQKIDIVKLIKQSLLQNMFI